MFRGYDFIIKKPIIGTHGFVFRNGKTLRMPDLNTEWFEDGEYLYLFKRDIIASESYKYLIDLLRKHVTAIATFAKWFEVFKRAIELNAAQRTSEYRYKISTGMRSPAYIAKPREVLQDGQVRSAILEYVLPIKIRNDSFTLELRGRKVTYTGKLIYNGEAIVGEHYVGLRNTTIFVTKFNALSAAILNILITIFGHDERNELCKVIHADFDSKLMQEPGTDLYYYNSS